MLDINENGFVTSEEIETLFDNNVRKKNQFDIFINVILEHINCF
jgi:hypothetical protein